MSRLTAVAASVRHRRSRAPGRSVARANCPSSLTCPPNNPTIPIRCRSLGAKRCPTTPRKLTP